MIINVITAAIGVGMLFAFVGIMVWWVKAIPLIIIFATVFALMLYDFVCTLRYGEAGMR